MVKLKFITLMSCMLFLAACDKDKDEEEKVIACIPAGLSKDVIAFYPFSNGSLNDISGNNEHLSNATTAVPSEDRSGNLDCAYEFRNLPTASEFLTTTNTTFLNNLSAFTISLWYLAKDTSRPDGIFETLISRDDTANCPNRSGQWSIGLFDCRLAFFGRTNSVRDRFLPGNLGCHGELVGRTDTWTHTVAVYDESGITMKFYRNGVLQQEKTGHGNCSSGIPSSQDIGDLFIGKSFTGKIDDVIILNKALSQAEVQSLFNMGACCL